MKNDQVRKRQKQSSKDAIEDSEEHSMIWRMFMSCKYNTSNDVFPRCKSVHKMATGKSDDQLIQYDNKLELGPKVDIGHECVVTCMTRTPMTTCSQLSMIAW